MLDTVLPMNFDFYQTKVAETAIYPESGTGSAMALAYVGLGLGESGEIQGKIKKILRDNGGVGNEPPRSSLIQGVGDKHWDPTPRCSTISPVFSAEADQNPV